MSNRKLIKQLQEKNLKLSQSELSVVINTLTENINNILGNGYNLEIRGFGRWFVKKLKKNFNARNPATNELIYKPERYRLRFKSSKNLKKRINE